MPEISSIGILTAFLAGAASFQSPCVLPLVPGSVSYVACSATGARPAGGAAFASRLPVLGLSLCFVLGFSTVFVALCATNTVFCRLLISYRYELELVGGAIVVLFGLFVAGVAKPGWMMREARLHVALPGGRPLSAYVLGLAFAFGWTPCIGPILGAILTVGAATATVADGVALLAIYSLGLGLPFLLAAAFTGALTARLKAIGRVGRAPPAGPRDHGADGHSHDHRRLDRLFPSASRNLPDLGNDRLTVEIPVMVRVFTPSLSDSATTAGQAGIGRRCFTVGLAALAGLAPLGLGGAGRAALAAEPVPAPATRYPMYEEAVSRVIPVEGFQSRIALGDAVMRLMSYGVVDAGRMFALYGTSGGLPDALSSVLAEPLAEPIRLTTDNAGYYVNMLWPIGLATRMQGNEESPLNGESLYRFASTGGWTLGQAENGGAYFNEYPIVDLTPDQEAMVLRIAKSTYRPCCNNSTFFQDCNHGSALLGVLQLGAEQGLSEPELYREALAFNSFWFPQNYIRTALYLKFFERTEWPDADPAVVLGFRYSAGSPWQENVARPLAGIRGLIPVEPGEDALCAL